LLASYANIVDNKNNRIKSDDGRRANKIFGYWFWFNDDGREEGCRLNEAKCQIEIKLKI